MKTRLQEAIERQGRRGTPIPSARYLHACGSALGWALEDLDAACDAGGDVAFHKAEGILLNRCVGSYEHGRHEGSEGRTTWVRLAWWIGGLFGFIVGWSLG